MTRTWLAAALALGVVAAPLAFGSTSRLATLALALFLSGLALAALAAGARPEGSWPMAALILLPCAQLVPLPGPLLATISPRAERFHALADAATGTERSGAWHPLSLDPQATLAGALLLGAAACLFGVARFCAAHRPARRLMISVLIAMGLFEAAYGLAEQLGGRRSILGWPRSFYLDSATGTFVNRNHFAGYLEMTLMVSLGILTALALAASRELRDGGTRGWIGGVVAISTPRGGAALLLGGAACVMVAALLYSRSRAGAASAAGGAMVVALLAGRGRARRIAITAIGAVMAAGVLYTLASGAGTVAGRLDRTVSDLSGAHGRLPLWSDAAVTAGAFLATGAGLMAFEQVFPAMRTREDPQLRRHAHNDYLEVAAEMGIAGPALVLLLAGRFARKVWRAARPRVGTPEDDPLDRGCALGGLAAAAALAIHSLFDFNLHVPANLLTLALVCALALPVRRVLTGPRRVILQDGALA